MPLHFAKQTACRRRRNFGLVSRHRPDPARSSHEIQFYLAGPGLVKTCYNCGLPPGTPMARVLQARDVLMAAVDKGLIQNPKAWREYSRQLAGRVRALNRRDGIHPLKPGPKSSGNQASRHQAPSTKHAAQPLPPCPTNA